MRSPKQLLPAAMALSFLSGCVGLNPKPETANAVNAVNYGVSAALETKAVREKEAQKKFKEDFAKKSRSAK